MAAPLEPGQDDDPEQVPEVQAFGRGIEATVDFEGIGCGSGARGPEVLAGDGLDEAPFLENVDDVGGAGGGVQPLDRRLEGFGGGLRGAAAEEKGESAGAAAAPEGGEGSRRPEELEERGSGSRHSCGGGGHGSES